MTVEQRLEERCAFLAAMKGVETCKDVALCRQDLVNSLIHLYPRDVDAETLLREFTTFIEGLSTEQLERVVVWAGPNMDLPHHESLQEEISERVQHFRAFLFANSLDRANPPDSVLKAVLTVLEHVFGPLDHRVIEYDAAEDGDVE